MHDVAAWGVGAEGGGGKEAIGQAEAGWGLVRRESGLWVGEQFLHWRRGVKMASA